MGRPPCSASWRRASRRARRLRAARACLIDLDVQFGDAAFQLGLQPKLTFSDLVAAGKRLDGDLLRSVVAVHPSGLQCGVGAARDRAAGIADQRPGDGNHRPGDSRIWNGLRRPPDELDQLVAVAACALRPRPDGDRTCACPACIARGGNSTSWTRRTCTRSTSGSSSTGPRRACSRRSRRMTRSACCAGRSPSLFRTIMTR